MDAGVPGPRGFQVRDSCEGSGERSSRMGFQILPGPRTAAEKVGWTEQCQNGRPEPRCHLPKPRADSSQELFPGTRRQCVLTRGCQPESGFTAARWQAEIQAAVPGPQLHS